jgi:hypothetical protein
MYEHDSARHEHDSARHDLDNFRAARDDFDGRADRGSAFSVHPDRSCRCRWLPLAGGDVPLWYRNLLGTDVEH